jgi:SAM-dependent methyltransferase
VEVILPAPTYSAREMERRRIDDPEVVAREYATLERLALRRIDRTAWLRSGSSPWLVALGAIARVKPKRVLDAGCGSGGFAALIAAPTVVGIDLSAAAVESARSRGLHAARADLEHLPFADGSFDCVTCNWVLYHVPDRDRAIAELARVTGPGGRFVGMYNAHDHMAELWSAVGDPWKDEEPFRCESAVSEISRHFDRVRTRDVHAEAMWESREALQTYLDAHEGLAGPLTAPDSPYPFRVSRHNCVIVADRT